MVYFKKKLHGDIISFIWVQDPAALVIDHSSYAVSNTEGDHTLIASDEYIKSDVILGSKKIEASANIVNISH